MLQTSLLIDRNDSVRATERRAMVEIVEGLAALDESKGYREYGYSSLFSYATERLKYSEGSAMRRITAARLSKEHGEVLRYLASGELSLCVLVELAKIDSKEKQREILLELLGKSKREAQAITEAIVSPAGGRAQPKALVVKPSRRFEVRGGLEGNEELPLFAVSNAQGVREGEAPSTNPPSHSVTGGDERREPELVFSLNGEIDGETAELLERARRLFPQLSIGEVLKRGLRDLVRKHDPREREKRRKERNQAKRERRAVNRARRFSTATGDAAFVRDEGRCTFVSDDGRRCSATEGLELDHVVPFALGGESVGENCRLLCRAHNQLAAERAGLRWQREEVARAAAY